MRFQHNPFTDKLDISGMGPGTTSVDFVTGNSGGVVAADASYNINLLGDNASGVNTIGNLSPSTLTIFGLASTTSQIGTTRYATNLEASGQSSTTTALTPSNITSLFSVTPLPASQGGTGLSSPAAHSLLVTNGSSAFTALGTASNGQIPIGSIGSNPVLANITSTGGTIDITNGPGSINLELAGGSIAVDSFSPDSGTDPVVPTVAGLVNIKGSGSVTTVGSLNTITTQLTGLTSHNLLVGAGTSTITKVAPSATSGVPVISQGAAADPTFGTAVVAGGGTGSVSFNANGVVISNTTTTGALSSLTLTNGQMVIGSTGVSPVAGTITSTDSSITVSTGAGTLNLAVAGGTTVGKTITGNSGGALSPTAGNWNILGTGSTTAAGSGSTLTVQLTGLTNHNVLVGAGTATVTNVAPSATSGIPLISQGSSADPVFGTAVVAGGGTGAVTLTGVLIGNGTSAVTGNAVTNHNLLVGGASNAITSVAPSATSGVPVISQGSSSDPTFGTAVVAGGGTGATSFTANGAVISNTTTTGALASVALASQKFLVGTSGAPTAKALSVISQVFINSGTYTPTTGMVYCVVEVVGGGGGGGGCAQAGSTKSSAAGGGGGGGYARGAFSSTSIGASQTVTIGAAGTAGTSGNNNGGGGGTTSLGALISATGGNGGSGAAAGSSGSAGGGGAGSGGDFQTTGTPGIAGTIFYTATVQSNIQGSGGSSFFGGGALGDANASGTGRTATSFGGGGAGGGDLNSSNQSGGAGAKGVVIVTEYVIS